MTAKPIHRRKFGARYVRVALLVATALLVFGYGVYRVGAVLDVFARRYEVVTLVPSALGLREGAPVTLAGQRIGQVSAIEFISPAQKIAGNHLLIRLAISEEVRDQIRVDSRAFLRTQGLLGDKFVDIQPGTPGAPLLAAGDTMVAGTTVDIDEFMSQAASAVDSALLVVGGVRRIAEAVARGEGTLGRLLTEDQLYHELLTATTTLRGTLTELNRADGTFGRLLRDPTLYDAADRALARLDTIGEVALQGDGTIGRLLRSDTLHNELLATIARADTAVMHIAQFLTQMTEADGTMQRLFTDPALYDEVLRAITDVQTLINAIRQDPTRFRPDVRVRIF
jgi:phospholipid/cholesterol/gamma-HCH transport system substrate-binding protein